MTANFVATHVLAIFLALLGTFIYLRRKNTFNLPLPPGPRKLPLLGNLLDLPTSFEWETFQVWGNKYSSCVALFFHFIRIYLCLYRLSDSPCLRSWPICRYPEFSTGSPRSLGKAFVYVLRPVSHCSFQLVFEVLKC